MTLVAVLLTVIAAAVAVAQVADDPLHPSQPVQFAAGNASIPALTAEELRVKQEKLKKQPTPEELRAKNPQPQPAPLDLTAIYANLSAALHDHNTDDKAMQSMHRRRLLRLQYQEHAFYLEALKQVKTCWTSVLNGEDWSPPEQADLIRSW